ncbi:hypothetical protein Goarm_021591 [Gossypium armourianum]|uniref:Uncharacterized protein n=1 Tax=Gossypium armourianum TaxID=34283 RepID=A0A7J9IS43_9ROSI|nr:hypothetical protein [Gossypium armourianum]
MMEPKLPLPQSSGKRARACQMELIMRRKETSDNLLKKASLPGLLMLSKKMTWMKFMMR